MMHRLLQRMGLILVLVMALTVSPAMPAFAADAYRLGYGDAVSVTVIGQPTLSTVDQAIRPDGKISLPLVQEVQVQGRTVPEVVSQLTKAFRPYLAAPQIMVNVTRFRPMRVAVLGQVAKPGTFELPPAATLVEAIAIAGGLSDRASRHGIRVVDASGVKTYDLDKILSGEQQPPRLTQDAMVEVAETWTPDWYRMVPIAASLISASAILATNFVFF